jgi:hypothetical protein
MPVATAATATDGEDPTAPDPREVRQQACSVWVSLSLSLSLLSFQQRNSSRSHVGWPCVCDDVNESEQSIVPTGTSRDSFQWYPWKEKATRGYFLTNTMDKKR